MTVPIIGQLFEIKPWTMVVPVHCKSDKCLDKVSIAVCTLGSIGVCPNCGTMYQATVSAHPVDPTYMRMVVDIVKPAVG